MAYPDWVMRHKKKGMYVNKVNETTYRIYRGHSERVKGTDKVRRVVDEYIGTITEAGGLVPTKAKVKGAVRSLRSGGYALIRWFCRSQMDGILRRRAADGAAIVAAAVLQVLYGEANELVYENDWVSVVHPGLSFPLEPALAAEAARVARGMGSTLSSALGDGLGGLLQASGYVCRVWVNGQWVDAEIPGACRALALSHGFRWEA